MNNSFRFLLGLSIVIIVGPAAVLVLGGDVGDLMPWSAADDSAGSPMAVGINPASEQALLLPSTSEGDSDACPADVCPESDEGPLATSTTGVAAQEAADDSTPATTPDPADGDEPGNSGEESSAPKTTSPKPPTADAGSGDGKNGSGQAPAAVTADGQLTGKACPCMVSGTVQLVGNVDLQGDIMVDGGTLVARPGVSVDGNGHQIMFMNGGRADFQGSPTSSWSGNGSNANLSRDVTFSNMRRIMFHTNAGKSTLKYFSITDSGTSNVLGDYPLHFHLNGNSVRGTLVEGVAVINGRNHAFVPHGSNGITFKNTIAWNTSSTAYWWDAPGTNNCSGRKKTCTADNSSDIVFDHALAYKVKPPSGSNGIRTAGFQLGAGKGNVVKNSVATNVTGGKDCSGFHWPEDANQNVGGTVWVFVNNSSYSPDCHGTFVWQNDEGHHVINGFSGSGIDHGAYVNKYEYRNVNVPYFEVHALGWLGVTGGSVGDVYVGEHNLPSLDPIVFQDVQVKSVVVNNSDGNNDNPSILDFNNTGLTCDKVDFQNVVPGTKVRINGTEC